MYLLPREFSSGSFIYKITKHNKYKSKIQPLRDKYNRIMKVKNK